MAKSPTITRHRGALVALTTICAIVTSIVIWIVFVRLPALTSAVNTGNDRVQSVTTLAAQNQAKLQANNLRSVGPPAQSVSAGKATAPPTAKAPISPAPTYIKTVQPTQSQVTAAVSAYFQEHPPKPPISAAALTTKVASFVAAYLRAHPAPAGKSGANGSPGPTGIPGPGPTDEQIAAAVQSFLPGAVAAYLVANPPASGPPGPSGAAGPSGANGQNGINGSDGAPPAEWNWTDPDGTFHDCIRNKSAEGDADLTPHYDCTTVPSSGDPSPTRSSTP